MSEVTKDKLDWSRDLDFVKVNLQTIKEIGDFALSDGEIEVLIQRVDRVSTYIAQLETERDGARAVAGINMQKAEQLEQRVKDLREIVSTIYDCDAARLPNELLTKIKAALAQQKGE